MMPASISDNPAPILGIQLSTAARALRAQRSGKSYTVLCGANNSGKSLLLKWLNAQMGAAYLVGPARFFQLHSLGQSGPGDIAPYQKSSELYRQELSSGQGNSENNPWSFEAIFRRLTDGQRQKLFMLAERLIGAKFELRPTDPNNVLSAWMIDMDGRNLSLGSTGTRLLLALLAYCMFNEHQVLLIDEPELGLSPKVQAAVAEILSDDTERAEYFPHLKSVFIATHSHLFLDRRDITNNFRVVRSEGVIDVAQILDLSGLNSLQFNLVGNTLESLFLPSAIVIVEGKTDKPYLERLIQHRFPDNRIVVMESQGDVGSVFNGLRMALGEIQKSPYRDRIFIVMDEVHTPGTNDKLIRMGAKVGNVINWSKNGIEYFYPRKILELIFSASESQIDAIDIIDDNVSLNGITWRKVDLLVEVQKHLKPDTPLPSELEAKLMTPLAAAISI